MNNDNWFEKDIFSFIEGCKFCNLSKDRMYYLTANRLVPHFKPRGKKIYFLKDDLVEWLLQNRVPTINESEREATKKAIA